MKNNIREILDKTNINVLDEINILEYIDELEQIKEDYIKSLDKLDVLENRLDKAIEELEEEIEQSDGCIYVELPEELYIKKLQKYLDILRGEDNESN